MTIEQAGCWLEDYFFQLSNWWGKKSCMSVICKSALIWGSGKTSKSAIRTDLASNFGLHHL